MGLCEYNGFSEKERWAGDKIVKKAIEMGELPHPNELPCERCGQDKGVRVWHCEDYSPENILNDLTLLCWRCHRQIHTRSKDTEYYRKYEEDINDGKKYPPVYMKWWKDDESD